MGLMDKIKGLFKKSEAPAAKKCKCGCEGKAKAKPKTRASEFPGDDNVSKALRSAAEKIDAKVATGKLSDNMANVFMDRLKGIKASDADESVKIVNISQVIGGIINAA